MRVTGCLPPCPLRFSIALYSLGILMWKCHILMLDKYRGKEQEMGVHIILSILRFMLIVFHKIMYTARVIVSRYIYPEILNRVTIHFFKLISMIMSYDFTCQI